MTRRVLQSADLDSLSGCAAELAEAFVSLSSDIALVMDEHGVIQSVAQSLTAPIASDTSAWIGRHWAETVSGETRVKVASMLSDLKSTGVARRREINVEGSSTAGVPVSFSALRLGEFGPMLAVGKDLRAVSAIQQRFVDAQQELERGYWQARQAESRYRLLFQVATDAVLTVDAQTLQVLEASPAAVDLLGAGLALAGRASTEVFDRSSRGAVRELLQSAARSGKPAEIHARMPHTQALAAVSATPFRSNEGLRLLVRVRFSAGPPADSADLNKTLALLVNRTRDGVVVTDSSGRIVVANPAFLSLLGGLGDEQTRGHALGEWLGRVNTDVSAVIAGAHQHGLAQLVRSSLRRSGTTPIEVDVTVALLAEGEQECFGFTIRPCSAKTEAPTGWVEAIAQLDDPQGPLSLAQRLAESRRLVEQRFAAEALALTQGDVDAAAALLNIAVAELLQAQSGSAASVDSTAATPR